MREKNIHQYFDRRYTNNKYAGAGKYKARDPNPTSPQYPDRMWRPKREIAGSIAGGTTTKDPLTLIDPDHITEDDFDLLLIPPEKREAWLKHKKEKEQEEKEPSKYLQLEKRHRYGDDVDILRATFTKSKEDIENETFALLLACRHLSSEISASLKDVPKQEKYVLGAELRSAGYRLIATAVRIKKKYYRKNMLEDIDIDCEILRELYFEAHRDYPEWVDSKWLERLYNAINDVGRIVGGLLKSTVV